MMPRLLTLDQLAEYLGHQTDELKPRMGELRSLGMPEPIQKLERWDLRAIDTWLDYVSGLTGNYAVGPKFPTRPFNNPNQRCSDAEPPHTGHDDHVEGYTVADAIDDYIRTFRGSPISLRNSIYHVNADILPVLGDIVVEDLKSDQIRAMMDRYISKPRRTRSVREGPIKFSSVPFDSEAKRRRKASCNRVLSVLRAALNQAYRDGKVPYDDAWRRIRGFKSTTVKRSGFLSEDKIHELMKFLPPDFKKLVQVGLLTGVRFFEAQELLVEDFNAEDGTIFVQRGKRGKPRHVILNPEGVRLFKRLTKGRDGNERMLLKENGDPWLRANTYDRFGPACSLAGISPRITFHHLRHTYAAIAIKSGIPLIVVAKNLGHTHSDTCEKHYGHLAPGYVAGTIRKDMPALGIVK